VFASWLRAAVATMAMAVAPAGMASGMAAGAGQETRGSILGTVKDSSGAVLPAMVVVVTNEETNVAAEVVTNERGYFEVPYLVPGTYRISIQVEGFKKFTQTGVVLTVNNRVEVPIKLDMGSLVDEVTVAAEAPLLDTTSASASTSLSNRQVNSLPVFGNSAMLLARSVPGMQWTGQPNYLGLHSNAGASGTNAAGGVGGNEYSLDGVSNSASERRVAYLPYTDTVAEIKVETAAFDASKGHGSGAAVSAMTKSGTNAFRGSATWQYWNSTWNATQSTTNAAYYGAIEKAIADGNNAEAERLRGQPKSPAGHSNNWATVLGGPVKLPRLFNGRDKLFFFFSYNGFKDVKSEEVTAVNRTVPTEAQRRGDFSDLLRIDPVRYQIYDPRTARLENGRVVRDPFPNNQVPILNPVYAQYLPLIPLPNNPAGIASPEGQNNYLASATPFNWDYKAFSTRVDWNLSNRHRTFARWSWNDFLEDRSDWTYETARGLMSNGLVRQNLGATVDHVFVQNGTTIWNASVAYNRFTEGNRRNDVQTSFSPAAVGFPAYMEDRARAIGGATHLPRIDFSDNSYSDFGVDRGGFSDYGVITARGELAKILSTHSVKTGVDFRQHRRENIAGGSTSGVMTPRNDYVRQRDNTNNAGLLGLEWAAFMLGVTGITMDNNTSYRTTNPYYAAYVQDDWRVSNSFTLNLGVRVEYEGGFVESDNKAIGEFDFDAELPISDAAEQAYLRNPIAGVPSIEVRGGSLYAGLNGAPEALNNGQTNVMPRLGAVWKVNDKTVVRGGYGLFYDTNNVLVSNAGVDQSGFSRGTGRTLTNNNGLTFLDANLAAGRTILHDPFPVREDGTRYNEPYGNALGISAKAGRGFDYEGYDWKRAKQQRWRVGVQREISRSMVAEAAYLGSYSTGISIGDPWDRINALPGEFWSTGNVRNDANADYLNALVPNPFNIANFEFLRTQDPLLYQDMAANGFFTATTIRRHQLLRALPHMTSGDGLRNTHSGLGETKYHHLELSLQKRLSNGYEFTVGYTRAWHRDRDIFDNEFDERPTWRPSNDSRPHHLLVTGIVDLPFGDGKRWLANSRIGRAVLGGWQVSGIYHLQSGRFIDWGNRFYYGDSYEDIVLPRGERDRARWFNTDDFERASARQPASFHARVFPRRLDFAKGDYMNQLDMALSRSVGLWGSSRFQVTLSAINVLNNVQWDQPNTDPTNSNFGVVTQQWNTPRWLQLQGRFTF
jgi:hypothetical protein